MIRLRDISHVAYYVPDLHPMQEFLSDFGMRTVQRADDALYMGGAGDAPYVHVSLRDTRRGLAYIALEVESEDQLEAASRLAGASSIQPLAGPKSGRYVRLIDPDGVPLHLVRWDATSDTSTPTGTQAEPAMNSPQHKPRKGEPYRHTLAPAAVHRLGHILLHVRNLARTRDWYVEHLGLTLSDALYENTPDNTVAGFFRLPHGEQYVDHHCLGFVQVPPDVPTGVHHSSFEVASFDAIGAGHQWLARRGWTPRWGVGRHILGSQIFDYWYDPAGHVIEHYTDGDVFNHDAPAGQFQNGVDMLAGWAPPYPAAPPRSAPSTDGNDHA